MIGCPQILFWFLKIISERLEHCDFFDPQGRSWRSPYQNQNNLDYLKIKIVKVSPQIKSNIVCPIKNNLSQLIHKLFGRVSIASMKRMARKRLGKGLPTNQPDL